MGQGLTSHRKRKWSSMGNVSNRNPEEKDQELFVKNLHRFLLNLETQLEIRESINYRRELEDSIELAKGCRNKIRSIQVGQLRVYFSDDEITGVHEDY